MIPKVNYPNIFFSPTYPLRSNSNAGVSFAGLPGYEPEVYEASLRESSFNCSQDPKVGQRLNFNA